MFCEFARALFKGRACRSQQSTGTATDEEAVAKLLENFDDDFFTCIDAVIVGD
jgi:hypothetical protein